MFRLSVVDLDSPSYFVATAAVELGFFRQEGIEIELERAYGVKDGPERLRDGTVHFLAGPAYAATRAFPAWKGAKLLCALAQYAYWFLAVRADLDVRRGDVAAVKGLRIASSQSFPKTALIHLLTESGIDLERDNVRIVPSPHRDANEQWHGHDGADAIKQNIADAYWGNGMRVAIGESLGVAKLHLDLRRGDGPAGARRYNFAALTTTERLVDEQPDIAAGAVRAIVKTQMALEQAPSLATDVARRLFPPDETALIAGLIAKDAPFYSAEIPLEAVEGINRFAKANGLIAEAIPYDRLVASQFRHLWGRQAC